MQGCCLGCIGLLTTIVVGAIAVIVGLFKLVYDAVRKAPIEILYVVIGLIVLAFLFGWLQLFLEERDEKDLSSQNPSTYRKLTKKERRAEARAKAEAKKAAEAAAEAEKMKVVAMLNAPIEESKIENVPISPYVKKIISKYGLSIFDNSKKDILDELLEKDDSLCSCRLLFLSILNIPQLMFEQKNMDINQRQQVYNECLMNLKQNYGIDENDGKILLNEISILLGFSI
jgi:hypothetical protein